MEDEEEVEEKKYQNLDDSAVGQSDSSGLVASLDDEEDEDVVFENEMKMNNVIFSPSVGRRRSRQQSTSLMRHPIEDDNLKDYHEHRMEGGKDPFDISYSLYSVIVSQSLNFRALFFDEWVIKIARILSFSIAYRCIYSFMALFLVVLRLSFEKIVLMLDKISWIFCIYYST